MTRASSAIPAAAAMRSGLFLPIFGELAGPAAVARLSHEAEEVGWHGVFVWDHVRWRQPVLAAADPWITLAAVATAPNASGSGRWSRRSRAGGR